MCAGGGCCNTASVCGLRWPAAAVACHGEQSLRREEADGTTRGSGVCHIIESVSREEDDDDDGDEDEVAPGSGVYVNVNPVA